MKINQKYLLLPLESKIQVWLLTPPDVLRAKRTIEIIVRFTKLYVRILKDVVKKIKCKLICYKERREKLKFISE